MRGYLLWSDGSGSHLKGRPTGSEEYRPINHRNRHPRLRADWDAVVFPALPPRPATCARNSGACPFHAETRRTTRQESKNWRLRVAWGRFSQQPLLCSGVL